MKCLLIAITLALMMGSMDTTFAQSMKPSDNDNIRIPVKGYVPNAKVAEQIAYAVLVPVYGREDIDFQRPFKTKLIRRGTRWRVEGTLPESVAFGGEFVVEISKRDARILRMVHYR